MKIFNILLLLLVFCSTTSCISIFQGTRSEIRLNGNMNTPVNVAAGKDCFENLTLPCTIKVKKKTKNLLVYAPNYEMQNITLKRKFNALYLLNYVGTVGFIVDACNGVTKKIVDKEFNVTLSPSLTIDAGYMDVADYYYNQDKEELALHYIKKAIEINPLSKRAYEKINYIESERQRKQERSERRHQTWAAIGQALGDLSNALSASSTSSAIASGSGAIVSTMNAVESSNENNSKKSQAEYERLYQIKVNYAQNLYRGLTSSGGKIKKDNKDVGGTSTHSMTSFNNQKNLLRKTQREMREIRMKASRDGYKIQQSEYETIEVIWDGAKQYTPSY